MVRKVHVGLALVLGSALTLAAGCGSSVGPLSADAATENGHRNSLGEVGALLRVRKENAGKPPMSSADLAKYEIAFPVGLQKVKSGEVVVLFGAPVDESATDKIVAYEKMTPESGGYVLMQDTRTIQKLSPEEFKAASKAPGKAEESPK